MKTIGLGISDPWLGVLIADENTTVVEQHDLAATVDVSVDRITWGSHPDPRFKGRPCWEINGRITQIRLDEPLVGDIDTITFDENRTACAMTMFHEFDRDQLVVLEQRGLRTAGRDLAIDPSILDMEWSVRSQVTTCHIIAAPHTGDPQAPPGIGADVEGDAAAPVIVFADVPNRGRFEFSRLDWNVDLTQFVEDASAVDALLEAGAPVVEHTGATVVAKRNDRINDLFADLELEPGRHATTQKVAPVPARAADPETIETATDRLLADLADREEPATMALEDIDHNRTMNQAVPGADHYAEVVAALARDTGRDTPGHDKPATDTPQTTAETTRGDDAAEPADDTMGVDEPGTMREDGSAPARGIPQLDLPDFGTSGFGHGFGGGDTPTTSRDTHAPDTTPGPGDGAGIGDLLTRDPLDVDGDGEDLDLGLDGPDR